MNMHRALSCKSESVGLLSKKSVEKTIRCIRNLFIGTSIYFDKPLTERQADTIAEEILANYNYRQLKLEDILAICIEIKESDTFKLTPARILRFISRYVKDRENLSIERHQQMSKNLAAQCGENNMDERILKSIRSTEKTTQIVIKNRLKDFNKPQNNKKR